MSLLSYLTISAPLFSIPITFSVGYLVGMWQGRKKRLADEAAEVHAIQVSQQLS